MNGEPVELELAPPRATLWLNRPQAANAINAAMAQGIADRIDQLEVRDDIRVLFIRGRGGRFCAGADLGELTDGDLSRTNDLDMQLAVNLERLAALPMIVVAVVETFGYGGGFLIPLYADYRVATPGTRLGVTALGRQWLPPWGLARLALWLGPLKAQQLLIARGEVTAEEAAQLGLVDQVVDTEQLDDALEQLVDKLGGARGDVIREAKTFFAQIKGTPNSHWDRVSAAAFARTFSAELAQQAVAEFLSRRSPGRANK